MHVQLQAFAKINLDLRILAREVSGFHQIETCFQRIGLADVVDVRLVPGSGITLHCEPRVDVPDAENLAWRAAAAYKRTAHWPDDTHAIAIAIDKHIPAGGGLGGGSADAGAVLRALNAMNPTPLPLSSLLAIGATLGADVPFLTSTAPCALAWGRGERLLAIEPPPARTVHLATFREGVNTAAAYRALAAARDAGTLALHPAALRTATEFADWTWLSQHACNDFESPVFALRPDVAAVHGAWREAAPRALVRMSGSGATVFAATAADESDAVAAAATRWPHDGTVQYRTAQTLTHVPDLSIL